MAISNPKVRQHVEIIERPQIHGDIIEVVNEGYVIVKFDTIPEPAGVSTDRIQLCVG